MASWHEGAVPADKEHIEILVGSVDADADFTFVARVGRTEDPNTFVVEFAPDRDGAAIEAVQSELDFYLADKEEDDHWAYAIYHCSSASSLYGNVHWGYWPEGKVES